MVLSGGFLPQASRGKCAISGVRQETGKEYVVKVHCNEGVAIRIGPKPCAGTREGVS